MFRSFECQTSALIANLTGSHLLLPIAHRNLCRRKRRLVTINYKSFLYAFAILIHAVPGWSLTK